MDARVRWLQIEWPTVTTILELPICLGIMGAMALTALNSFARVQQHLHVLEAVSIVAGPEVAMMEYHAVTGAWPASNEQTGYSAESLVKVGGLSSVLIRDGGAVDLIFSNRAADLAGKILTVRAWQASGPGLPAAWRCGYASPAPLVTPAANRTTLADDELPSSCRGRP